MPSPSSIVLAEDLWDTDPSTLCVDGLLIRINGRNSSAFPFIGQLSILLLRDMMHCYIHRMGPLIPDVVRGLALVDIAQARHG